MFYKNDFSNVAQPETEEEFDQWYSTYDWAPLDNNLPPEVKSAWVNALREPGRKQAKNRLQLVDSNGNKHQCCLGVLCELQGLESEPAANDYDDFSVWQFKFSRPDMEYGYTVENGLPDELFLKS